MTCLLDEQSQSCVESRYDVVTAMTVWHHLVPPGTSFCRPAPILTIWHNLTPPGTNLATRLPLEKHIRTPISDSLILLLKDQIISFF